MTKALLVFLPPSFHIRSGNFPCTLNLNHHHPEHAAPTPALIALPCLAMPCLALPCLPAAEVTNVYIFTYIQMKKCFHEQIFYTHIVLVVAQRKPFHTNSQKLHTCI